MKTKKESQPKRQRCAYSAESLQKAMESVRNGTSIFKASNMFKIPYGTLHSKVKGYGIPVFVGHGGYSSVLGKNVEEKLAEWVLGCAKMGFPVNKDGLIKSVEELVKKGDKKTPFKNNRPSKKWFSGFLKRHPEISQKKAEYVNKARATVTEENIRKWFSDTLSLLETNAEILVHPERVFNMDETGFSLISAGGTILGPKGKTVYDESSNSDKENVTTLFTVNANGDFAPPLTLFKYVRIPSIIVETAPPNWGIGKSENGWMTSETFFEYIANVFLPYLKKQRVQFPVIVFLDGHKSHLTLELSQFCVENGIVLVALYPNATHILQPLDVAVFGPMKKKWKKITRQWRIDNDGKEISKIDIPTALNKFLNDPDMKKNIKSGFKCTGLFPFDASQVDYSKIVLREIPVVSEIADFNNEKSLSHMEFIEENIEENLLQEFKRVREANIQWLEPEYLKLYEFWSKVKDKFENRVSNASFETHDLPDSEPEEQTTEHDSPEETEIASPNISFGSSLGEIVKDVIHWPKQSTTGIKRKRTSIPLPSVLTSGKWQEIHAAQEKEKMQLEMDKQERKRQRETKKLEAEKSKNIPKRRGRPKKNNS